MLESIPNRLLDYALSIGKTMGYELVVEVSDHSIDIQMERPDKTERAWDPDMYHSGNLYVSNYANPIKPKINYQDRLDTPDTIQVTESQTEDFGEDLDQQPDSQQDDRHIQLISSPRYRDYMRQDLISQLLTPQEQWKLLAYAVGAVAVLQFITIIIIYALA